ncbi:hypothetical protein D9M68_979790 [compost metagenome]
MFAGDQHWHVVLDVDGEAAGWEAADNRIAVTVGGAHQPGEVDAQAWQVFSIERTVGNRMVDGPAENELEAAVRVDRESEDGLAAGASGQGVAHHAVGQRRTTRGQRL